MNNDIHWMQIALALAQQAAQHGEVPVGAVFIDAEGQCIGQGYNRPINTQDPTAHAEIIAMRDAAIHLKNYRLIGTTIYVTLEPCLMCLGAMLHARVARLVFGAFDPKVGATALLLNQDVQLGVNHRLECTSGVLGVEAKALLQDFFREKR